MLEKESLPSVVPPSLGLPLPPLVLIFGVSANCGHPFALRKVRFFSAVHVPPRHKGIPLDGGTP